METTDILLHIQDIIVSVKFILFTSLPKEVLVEIIYIIGSTTEGDFK